MTLSVAFGILLMLPRCFTLDNGLALTPPMGWMTWERFRCNINCLEFPNECISENLIMRTADLMVSEGYDKMGYKYIVLDDCWLEPKRNEKGYLVPDRKRFPSGMLALSRYVHSKGLLFGLYEDYGTKTCAGYPGIIDDMSKDAITFAEWEVDYVKLDGCYSDPKDMDIGYPRFQKFLNGTGRPMVYSCSWPSYQQDVGIQPNFTAIIQNCNLWRNYDDIQDSWDSVLHILDYFSGKQNTLIPIAGPGHWNDPDMLIIGNFGLSLDQSKAQMALWCILAAPLLMSVDLKDIRPEFKEILQNELAIRVNQDSFGVQGRLITKVDDEIEIWRKPIKPVYHQYYSYGVVFLNKRTDGIRYSLSVRMSDLGLYNPNGYFIQDIFERKKYSFPYTPERNLTVKINPTGAVFLLIESCSENDIK